MAEQRGEGHDGRAVLGEGHASKFNSGEGEGRYINGARPEDYRRMAPHQVADVVPAPDIHPVRHHPLVYHSRHRRAVVAGVADTPRPTPLEEVMATEYKLYVWDDVLRDYAPGMAVAAARSVD